MPNRNAVAAVFDSPRKCRNRSAVDWYLIRDPRVGRSGQPWAGGLNRVAVKNRSFG